MKYMYSLSFQVVLRVFLATAAVRAAADGEIFHQKQISLMEVQRE